MELPKSSPFIIAHRGASLECPENTMAAFTRAQQLGVDAIEFDVHATRDGQLVVIHDYDISRTTSGRGLVHEMDAADILSLDAGSWFSPKFADARIPRLEDVVSLEDVLFEIELKGFSQFFINKVISAISQFKLLERAELTSPHLPVLYALRHQFPEARLGLFSPPRPDWMAPSLHEDMICAYTALTEVDVIHIPVKWLTDRLVASLRNAGRYTIHAADADDAETISSALAHSVDQFSTREVKLALDLAQNRS